MLITQQNNRLYDTRYFDQCQNYYAILINEKAIKINTEKDKEAYNYITISYDNISTLLIYTNDISNLKDHQNGYKIVYGHFYNEHNEFLYKQVESGKIVGYKVHRCTEAELWKNKLNKLYISAYFGEAKKTIKLLNTELNRINREENITPNTITYTVENNTLDFGLDFLDYMSSKYENKILELTPISKNIKIL